MAVDWVLTNGRIYTGDEGTPFAEAMAVGDGRLIAVGSASEVEALAGPGSRMADLKGRTIVPGLIDAHLHLLGYGLGLLQADLRGISSLEEALQRIRVHAESTPPGEWVLGGRWEGSLWDRRPTRYDLDAVTPGVPALLLSKDGHSQWANSLALKLAGIGPDTPNPPGGEIVRDPVSGEPTGLLLENAAVLASAAVTPPSLERCEAALEEALRRAAAVGLTGLHSFESADTFAGLQRLRSRGRLQLRVCCHLWAEALPDAVRLGLRTGFGDEWLRLGHLKLFLDGALGSRTAYMLEPYSGSDERGIRTMSREDLHRIVLEAVRAGIAPAIHAIGDAANRTALDVLEETAPQWRAAGLRPRIEHVQLLHPLDAARLGNLGIVASMQPTHATSDWPMAERYWSGRTGLAYAWRTVLDSGAVMAFGSDCPVESIDPMEGLYAAVTRRRADGSPPGGWHPEQRLSSREALRAYTVGSAYAGGEEGLKGSLTPGKLADFVVLSEDPISGPPEAFLSTKVEATVVGGRVVYGDV